MKNLTEPGVHIGKKKELWKVTDKKPENTKDLIQGRILARNTILNLIGYGTPLLVALIAIPILIKGLGAERFGVLTLVWVLISYIGLFDLGLGRALIKLVAENLGAGLENEIPPLIWTGLSIMCFIGLVVGGLTAVLLPWLVKGLLNIPLDLQKETLDAFYLIAVFVPIIVLSIALRGILDAHQRFDLTNTVRIPLGIFTFLAPVLVLPFTISLFHIVALILFGRMLACIVQAVFCFHIVPSLGKKIAFENKMAGVLVKFGGWMTITNIISPVMIYIDRFFISGIISVAAVAYYATPSEVVTKLTLVSGAMMAVFFPAFSLVYGQDKNSAARLFAKGVKYVFIIIFPLSLLIVILSYEGLNIWLGPEFAEKSFVIMQVLSLGVLFLCLGQVPYALIQGAGRPDITAKIHLIEIPFYIGVLFLLTNEYGIKGASIAWTGRLAVDSAIMFYIAMKMLGKKNEQSIRIFIVIGLTSAAYILALIMSGLFQKSFFICLFLPLYLSSVWFYIINSGEKEIIKAKVLKIWKSKIKIIF
ncbi:MAG: flippase [Deltaproteobacteria bacterium]|nr:flippase [Candidatus Desulfobacula maris]